MAPGHDLYRRLKSEARRSERTDFAARHPGLYLLAKFRDLPGAQPSFHTGPLNAYDPDNPHTAEQLPLRYVLWRVEKSDRNSWPRRISVGRASNNDVIIKHHTVSKLHAHFATGEQGELRLRDVGSQNGTQINGIQLEADDDLPVRTGDRLRFGGATCDFLDAGQLYGVLRQTITSTDLRPPKEPFLDG